MKKMNKNNKLSAAIMLASTVLGVDSVLAMQALTDGDLSGVTAQDGLTVQINTPGISISSLVQCFDSSVLCSSGLDPADLDASKQTLTGVGLTSIGQNGSGGSGNVTATATIDAFTHPDTGRGALALTLDWNRTRIKADNLLLGNDAQGIGNFALDASGRFELIGSDGFLNSTSDKTRLLLSLNDADLFFRTSTAANAPEVVLRDINFLWDMPQGIVGVDSQGILVQGNVNFNLTFDLMYDGAGATPLAIGTTAQDVPILRYGWSGGLRNAQFRLGGGGAWGATVNGSGESASYSGLPVTEGIRLGMRWDYLNLGNGGDSTSSFRWIVGEVDDNKSDSISPMTLEFGDWRSLPVRAGSESDPRNYAFYFPLVAIDMLRSGRGPGGLCWGANINGPAGACEGGARDGVAQYLEVGPEDHSMGVLIRDGYLRAYSNNVKITDPLAYNTVNKDRTLGWALIYTMGNIDGNMYLRPDIVAGTGMKADVLLMSQTFDDFDSDGDGVTWEQGKNWSYGTHFMIGDTVSRLGIGLANSSFLLAADNMNINLLPSGISLGDSSLRSGVLLSDVTLAGQTPNAPVRLSLNANFVGGDLPNMSKMVHISDISMNVEMDRFNLMLKPPVGSDTYLGFEATVHLANTNLNDFSHDSTSAVGTDPGTFLTLSEPGRPEAAVRFADIQGWIAARNGRLELKPDVQEVGTEELPPQLVLENDLLIGASVSGNNGAGAAYDVLRINRVELAKTAPSGFDYMNMGSIVIPSGQWYSRIALQPK